MKRELVIIKLGGSVITDKSKGRGSFRKEIVARLAKEIVEARAKNDFDLILVHGAGAYPHYLTTKYRIADGFKGRKSALGFAHIKKELFKLNNSVWQECLAAGLVVCTVQPSAVVFTSDGEIKRFDTSFIEALLEIGITPLLMGDDSADYKKGISILSGDKIVAHLGRKFGAKRIIFVSDVDGVFDKNPKVYKDAKLISQINDKNFKKVIDSMEVFNKNDASGEMKGKILAIEDKLSGFDVRLIGGFQNGALYNALLGNAVGTAISL